MNKKWELTGKIVAGVKQAAYFTQLDWVQQQCMEKLGFRPCPGTLNLEIQKDSLAIIGELQKKRGVKELVPPDPGFCSARILPVFLGKERGAIIIPDEEVQVHEKNVVEVIAPVNLKEALRVSNGDSLTVAMGNWDG